MTYILVIDSETGASLWARAIPILFGVYISFEQSKQLSGAVKSGQKAATTVALRSLPRFNHVTEENFIESKMMYISGKLPQLHSLRSCSRSLSWLRYHDASERLTPFFLNQV